MTPAKKAARNKRKTAAKSAKVAVSPINGAVIPLGAHPGNTGGKKGRSGRPADTIREAMRELGAEKGVPFLSEVLDGKVPVTLVGTCSHCGQESTPASADWLKDLMGEIKASVDQRLKANEQALKYGLSPKELVIASTEAASFFDCVYRATVERVGESEAEAIKQRAVALMDAKA